MKRTGVFILVILLFMLFYKYYEPHKLRCDSEILYTINQLNKTMTFDVASSIAVFDNGQGFMDLSGFLHQQENHWPIQRRIWFMWQKGRDDKRYDVIVENIEKEESADFIPERLMSLFHPKTFSLTVSNLGEHYFFIKGNTFPFLICRVY